MDQAILREWGPLEMHSYLVLDGKALCTYHDYVLRGNPKCDSEK